MRRPFSLFQIIHNDLCLHHNADGQGVFVNGEVVMVMFVDASCRLVSGSDEVIDTGNAVGEFGEVVAYITAM